MWILKLDTNYETYKHLQQVELFILEWLCLFNLMVTILILDCYFSNCYYGVTVRARLAST